MKEILCCIHTGICQQIIGCTIDCFCLFIKIIYSDQTHASDKDNANENIGLILNQLEPEEIKAVLRTVSHGILNEVKVRLMLFHFLIS